MLRLMLVDRVVPSMTLPYFIKSTDVFAKAAIEDSASDGPFFIESVTEVTEQEAIDEAKGFSDRQIALATIFALQLEIARKVMGGKFDATTPVSSAVDAIDGFMALACVDDIKVH